MCSVEFSEIFKTAYLKNTSKQVLPLFKVTCDVLFHLSTLKNTDTLMHSQNKAKGPTKGDSQIFLQAKIDF